MGKMRYEYQQESSKTSVKCMNNKRVKKSVKITYISSPLLVRTCHASEFRSVVQQLTGKDSSKDLILTEKTNKNAAPNNNNDGDDDYYWSNIEVQDQEQPASWVMQLQGGDAAAATMISSEFDANWNRGVMELEEEDCFWKQVATRSVLLQPPCFLLT